ncbi:signal peptide protein [Cryptosporidium sp. chipmunk genotype I]|uniref:signal peptide protein n=1 Tax=Cryptosporidium sp. chipmunk genotype I TaxID=1280935 RepID=UPI00351AA4DD|nr:signal peptide protein [Cryptosporidium sp. chipmunk genotype I]
MKLLYVFICVICLLNYSAFNQYDNLNRCLQLSLIKVKLSPGLSPEDSSNGENNQQEEQDPTEETDGNGSNSSQSGDPVDSNQTSPFNEENPRPPSPYRRTPRCKKLRRRFKN